MSFREIVSASLWKIFGFHYKKTPKWFEEGLQRKLQMNTKKENIVLINAQSSSLHHL